MTQTRYRLGGCTIFHEREERNSCCIKVIYRCCILLVYKNIKQFLLFMQITNSSTLFERWPGALIKLGIQCERESNCVILKIENAGENVSNVVYISARLLLPRYCLFNMEGTRTLHTSAIELGQPPCIKYTISYMLSHSVFSARERKTNLSTFPQMFIQISPKLNRSILYQYAIYFLTHTETSNITSNTFCSIIFSHHIYTAYF